jgi:hypothetical protein
LTAAVLFVPFADQVILRRLFRLPGGRPVIAWLANGYNAWIASAALLLLTGLYMLWVRYRFIGNRQLWYSAGCPQCMERELVRVSRKPGDRLYRVLAIPVYRYACRNCTWRGLRIARREYSAERERELEEALMRFQLDGLPVEQLEPDDGRPSGGIPAPAGSLFRDAGDVDWTEGRSGASAEVLPIEETVEEPNHHAEHTEDEQIEEIEWLWRRPADTPPG